MNQTKTNKTKTKQDKILANYLIKNEYLEYIKNTYSSAIKHTDFKVRDILNEEIALQRYTMANKNMKTCSVLRFPYY